MLVVVDRNKAKKIVSVLDTDDMVVEKIPYDEAKNLGVHIVGLGLENGVLYSYYKVNKWRIDSYCHTMISKFQNINITCKLHNGYNDLGLASFANNIRLRLSETYEYDLKSIDKLMYLCAYMVILKMFKTNIIHGSIKYCGLSLDYGDYKCSGFFIFYLCVLYNMHSGDSSMSISLDLNGYTQPIPDLKTILQGTYILEFRNRVYFCGSECVIWIKKDLISSLSDINKLKSTTAKYSVMYNDSVKMNAVSGVVKVGSCSSFKMVDRGIYSLSGDVYIDKLRVVGKNIKIRCTKDTCLNVKYFYADTDYDFLHKLNKYLVISCLETYTVAYGCFDSMVIEHYVSGTAKSNLIKFQVLGVDTSDKMVSLVKEIVTDKGIDFIKAYRCVDDKLRKRLTLLTNLESFNLLSPDLKYYLDVNNYLLIDDVEGLYNMNKERYTALRITPKMFNSMVAGATAKSSYYFHKDCDHIEYYNLLNSLIDSNFGDVMNLGEMLKGRVYFSQHRGGLCVKYVSEEAKTHFDLKSTNELRVVKRDEETLVNIKTWIMSEFGVSSVFRFYYTLDFVLDVSSFTLIKGDCLYYPDRSVISKIMHKLSDSNFYSDLWNGYKFSLDTLLEFDLHGVIFKTLEGVDFDMECFGKGNVFDISGVDDITLAENVFSSAYLFKDCNFTILCRSEHLDCLNKMLYNVSEHIKVKE